MAEFHEHIAELIYYVRIFLDRKCPNSPDLFSNNRCLEDQLSKLEELMPQTSLSIEEQANIITCFKSAKDWLHSDFKSVINDLPHKGHIPQVLQFNDKTGKYSEIMKLPLASNQYGFNLKIAMSGVYGGPGIDFMWAIDTIKKVS